LDFAQGCPNKAKHGLGLEQKIFCKLHVAMVKRDKLGLSSDQVDKIKALKMATKKDLIKRKAEIDLVNIDLKSKLWEDTVDKENTKKLVDKKYELKKEKAKALIEVFAEFKNILSDEQRKELKKIKCDHRKCPRSSAKTVDVKRPCEKKP
jgi:hypothetical protein